MAKKKRRVNISPLLIDFSNYRILKIYKNNSIIYRCKYCLKSTIKKENSKYIRIVGHSRNCKVFLKKIPKEIDIISNNNKNKIETKVLFKNSCKAKLPKNKNKKFNNKVENNRYLKDYSFENKKENTIIINNIIIYNSRIIGCGSFKKSYFAYNKISKEEVIANISKIKDKNEQCLNEINILKNLKNYVGFPRFIGYYKLEKYNVIFENLLGPSLRRILDFYGEPFSIQTICQIGIEILKRLQSLHSLNYLHNDIKPSNFCWGLFKKNIIQCNNIIFMIDFGLSTKINYNTKKSTSKTTLAIKENNNDGVGINKKICGNLHFMALNVLKGMIPSKKTEIESFIYLLLFLFQLKLPWSKIKSKNHFDKVNKIIEIHNKITKEELFKNIPYQILFIYLHLETIKNDETPDYNLYIKVLNDLLKLNNDENIKNFCWENKLKDILKKNSKLMKNNILNLKYRKLFEGYYIFNNIKQEL